VGRQKIRQVEITFTVKTAIPTPDMFGRAMLDLTGEVEKRLAGEVVGTRVDDSRNS
jgi:hypothetical protein